MASYNLGQVAIVSKGAWSGSATYAILNTVTHSGGTFMAIAPNSNVEPTVTSGWEDSWVPMARGIQDVTVTASGSTATVTVTLSDGTTATGGTYNLSAIAAGSITDTEITSSGISKIANSSVTAAKMVSTGANAVLPANVGIKAGTADPTDVSTPDSSATGIAPGQIYLKYSS